VIDLPPLDGGLRAKLASGIPAGPNDAARRAVCSTFVKLGSLEVIDVLAASGLDAVVIDLEHSQLDEAAARLLARHASHIGLPAVVRIPEIDRGAINRLLEAGAAGIQLSSVTTRRQVDALLAACRYPPAGERSVSLAQPAAAYGRAGIGAYLAAAAPGPLVVIQIETAGTDDPLERILGGVDVAFVGLTDLSVDVGAPGQLDSPPVAKRIAEIAAAAQRAEGRPAFGGWVPSLEAAGPLAAHGARYITAGSDLTMLAAAVSRAFPRGEPDARD
jgi:4-hydroxy-2-oxoheptanedioate aldolase